MERVILRWLGAAVICGPWLAGGCMSVDAGAPTEEPPQAETIPQVSGQPNFAPSNCHVSDADTELVSVELAGHACALVASGKVRCWGGPGPDGEVIGDDEPPAYAGWVDLPGRVTDIAVNRESHAVLADGSLWSWSGVAGEPEQVDVGEAVAEVAVEHDYVCVLLRRGGRVKCWGHWMAPTGRPEFSVLNRCSSRSERSPSLLVSPSMLPVVQLGGPAVSLVTGRYHACALMGDRSVRCWGQGWISGSVGYGNENNVGDDEHPDSLPPVPLGGPVSRLSASGAHTCAVRLDGVVLCWGPNGYGQLGLNIDEKAIGNDEPVVPHGIVSALDGVDLDAIEGGSQHTCALTKRGEVECWGRNYYSQLGIPGIRERGTAEQPLEWGQPVMLVEPARAIFMGGSSTCAVLQSGQLTCWGGIAARSYGRPVAKDELPIDHGFVPLFEPCR